MRQRSLGVCPITHISIQEKLARITGICLALLLWYSLANSADQTLSALPDPVAAPPFSLTEYEGDTRTLEDYRGQPLVVNFWATWCPPCRYELPSMNRAWRKIEDEGIAMIAINVGENEDIIFPFLADYPVDFTILIDHSGSIIDEWPVKGIPTTFVLDPEGRIVYRAIGSREWDDDALLDKVRALRKSATGNR